jgi:hypothetical protein
LDPDALARKKGAPGKGRDRAASTSAPKPPLVVRIRGPEGPFDFHLIYPEVLLEAALNATPELGPFVVESVDYRVGKSLTQGKALDLVAAGQELDVVATMASAARHARFEAVDIALDEHNLGRRVLVARADQIPRLAKVRSLADLRRLKLCSGTDWPDTDVYRLAKIPVVTKVAIDDSYQQVVDGRCDALSRAAFDAWDEVVTRGGLDVRIVPHLELHYPAAQVFYLKKGNRALKERLTLGLSRLNATGALDRLFQLYHALDLVRLGNTPAHVIELPHPLMPPVAGPEGPPAAPAR